MATESKKPSVLILGGVGFIGRNLVKYLVDNDLASFIKVTDKKMPATSYLHPDHKAAFAAEHVQYKQSDLSRERMVRGLFEADGAKFDYVINCCGETRPAMKDLDYKQKCLDTATTAATVAAEYKVTRWIELSHAWVYYSDSAASKEDGKLSPWTLHAQYRHQAEEALQKINGLDMVTLRPAYVYGPGDMGGLTPRLCVAACYKQVLKETMKFLWGGSLCYNTVHVNDVCKAIWHCCTSSSVSAGSIYNLADSSKLTVGKLNKMLEKIFGCKSGFHGTITSNLAKMNLPYVATVANNKHIPAWRQLCQNHNILNTPVTPYIDAELLSNNHLSVDGSKIQGTGFAYDHPQCTEAEIRSAVQFLVDQGVFPPVLQ
jgi:nucleoside-diphosphate-sugar epimerase